MNIGVIGAGIGGLAVACALAARGANVHVFEQASEINEVGAGLQISPNGVCVLRALGLESALEERARRGKKVSLRRFESDLEVAALDLARLPVQQSYHFVHRADLIDLLLKEALKRGVVFDLGKTLREIEPGAPAIAHFEQGESRAFDLIVDAGGLKSVLRTTLNNGAAPIFTKQTAWRALIPNTQNRVNDVQVHMAPKRHIVSYPIGNGERLNLVAVQERDEWRAEGWSHKDEPENLRAVFHDAGTEVAAMLSRVKEVHLWGLFRHPIATNWHAQGSAILGDAAHPTLPFLAQGANMALEDAWALAQSLTHVARLAESLERYQTLREPRVTRVIEAANANAWRYHLPFGPVRFAAHLGLAVGSRVAPGMLLKQFDWLYAYDITSEFPQN